MAVPTKSKPRRSLSPLMISFSWAVSPPEIETPARFAPVLRPAAISLKICCLAGYWIRKGVEALSSARQFKALGASSAPARNQPSAKVHAFLSSGRQPPPTAATRGRRLNRVRTADPFAGTGTSVEEDVGGGEVSLGEIAEAEGRNSELLRPAATLLVPDIVEAILRATAEGNGAEDMLKRLPADSEEQQQLIASR
jgi:hypothetical protein